MDRGVSLVETLVVVAIIGVLSVGAVLTMGPRDQGFARFERFVADERALAVATGDLRKVKLTSTGYRSGQGGTWRWPKRIAWTSAREIHLMPDGSISDIRITFHGGTECRRDGPEVTCDPA